MVSYYDHDFRFDEWQEYALNTFHLPDISPCPNKPIGVKDDLQEDVLTEQTQWQMFYANHGTGLFYKPRRYLQQEFSAYLTTSTSRDPMMPYHLLEVGCGHGSSVYPLLDALENTKFIATDFSQHALDIMAEHEKYDDAKISLLQWDICHSPSLSLHHIADAVLCVFVLSAIKPMLHRQVLHNMKAVIRNTGGYILFRDYGIHDMTMYRHTQRLDELLFRRNDGTLAFYFSQGYLQQLAEECGLTVVESSYATVIVRNRSSKKEMKRVFLHAVLYMKDTST